ncbi:MAG: HMG-box domain-containing protein [Sulfobacillus sp.]
MDLPAEISNSLLQNLFNKFEFDEENMQAIRERFIDFPDEIAKIIEKAQMQAQAQAQAQVNVHGMASSQVASPSRGVKHTGYTLFLREKYAEIKAKTLVLPEGQEPQVFLPNMWKNATAEEKDQWKVKAEKENQRQAPMNKNGEPGRAPAKSPVIKAMNGISAYAGILGHLYHKDSPLRSTELPLLNENALRRQATIWNVLKAHGMTEGWTTTAKELSAIGVTKSAGISATDRQRLGAVLKRQILEHADEIRQAQAQAQAQTEQMAE